MGESALKSHMKSMSENMTKFMAYYKKLPQVKDTCRIYEQNDSYFIFGEDALLIKQQVLGASKLKVAESNGEKLNYVKINKTDFVVALKYFVFVQQYKIEILKKSGTDRSPQWTVCYKASPGNLTAIADLILDYNDPYLQKSRGVMAIKITSEGSKLVIGIGFCDSVLREIQIYEFTDNPQLTKLQSVLVQLSPQECILPILSPDSKQGSPRALLYKIIKTHKIALTECKSGDFSAAEILQYLNKLLNVDNGRDFKGSAKEDFHMINALCAVVAVIKYLELLADENNVGQYSLSVFNSDLYSNINIESVTGLALFPENIKDFHEKRYLLNHLNKCCTHLGVRLLVQWIMQPLMDLRKLEERLNLVELFMNDLSLCYETYKIISRLPDMETVCRKIQSGKASTQDLHKMYMMMWQLPKLYGILRSYNGVHKDVLNCNFVADLKETIRGLIKYASIIQSTIDCRRSSEKFIFKAENESKFLEIRNKMKQLQCEILHSMYYVKEDLGLNSHNLRLKFSKKSGYFYWIAKGQFKSVHQKKGYLIIPNSSGCAFQSIQLRNWNEKYLSLKKVYEEKEKEIVDQISCAAASCVFPIKRLMDIVARLDVLIAFAVVSLKAPKPYVRPKLREKGECVIILKQGRHPILESRIKDFIPNEIDINKDKHSFFVTGPKMSGKSTYIKSVALNILLAQIGCFVPCDYAEISITDAFLTYNGFSKVEPSLIFEMIGCNTILKSATSSSFIMIDEMDCRMSNYEIFCWALEISRLISETIKAPCLFATNVHELTHLSKYVPSISNLLVETKSSEDGIIFLYHVKAGVSGEAIHVYFPNIIIKEANKKLPFYKACLNEYQKYSRMFMLEW